MAPSSKPTQGESLSVADKKAIGKAMREKIPFAMHADATLPKKRMGPVDILKTQAKTRNQLLVPIRHARMLASPFAFLRGTAAGMAQDLAAQARTNFLVQACGDMHVANFGVFASAERNLVFAINDFDETHPAPWEWDLKRLATSALIASDHLGGSSAHGEEAVRGAVRSYRQWMREYADMGYLDIWYSSINEQSILNTLSKEPRKRAEGLFKKARGRNHMQVLDKLTDIVDSEHRIKEEKPFVYRDQFTVKGTPIKELIQAFLSQYFASLPHDRRYLVSRYRVVDVARKVVGVGSVGTSCWIIFLMGKHDDDPLFLQVKQGLPSVLEPYTKKSPYSNSGHRIVVGQRMIQGSPDIFLGYGRLEEVDFYVRQLRDMKGGLEMEAGKLNVANFHEYTALCGWALALAHAKSGHPAKIAGYLGKSEAFDDAMVRFSTAYAQQNLKDFDTFEKAVKQGKLPVAERGS
jgi:uncharacterized protein (DUF2252 family)